MKPCTFRFLPLVIALGLAPALAAPQVPGDPATPVPPVAVQANAGQSHVADKIASSFTNLAGSEENALALVNALRTGGDVRLTSTTVTPGTGGAPPTTTTTTTTFDPPTKPMGWGNVKISLGLAQDALLKAGITKPTAQQLQAALVGGEVKAADGTTVALKGVLTMRAEGMGWGQIAHAGGAKVGPVVSNLKQTNATLVAQNAKPATTPAAPTTASGTPAAGKLTTAAGRAPSGGKITTAAGGTGAGNGHGHGKGVVVASATAGSTSSKGLVTAGGAGNAHASKGLVTADGTSAGTHGPKGKAPGHGVVTASGGSAGTQLAAVGGGRPASAGAGVVTASGNAGAGVTSAAGGGGNGKVQGNGGGNGKGKNG